MFVELSDVLELFFAHRAIEGSKGFCNLGLDICSTSNAVLPCRESTGTPLGATGHTSLSARWSSLSLSKRSEASSRRCETVVSIIRASWPYFPRPVISCFTWNGMGSTRPNI